MDIERATNAGRETARSDRPGGGRVVEFPPRRSFGPLSWRAVRIASVAVLVLIAMGALVQIFLGHALRNAGRTVREAPQAAP